MAILVNVHEFTGSVIAKTGSYAIKEDMSKAYLFCRGKYMINNRERDQDIRVTCFSWGDHRNRIADILPGDEVRFNFSLSGRFNPDRKDNLGAPSCWTECVLSGKVTILSSAQRKFYDNDPDKSSFTSLDHTPKPEFKYPDKNKLDSLKGDDPASDLPFVWFIPLLLPLASYLFV